MFGPHVPQSSSASASSCKASSWSRPQPRVQLQKTHLTESNPSQANPTTGEVQRSPLMPSQSWSLCFWPLRLYAIHFPGSGSLSPTMKIFIYISIWAQTYRQTRSISTISISSGVVPGRATRIALDEQLAQIIPMSTEAGGGVCFNVSVGVLNKLFFFFFVTILYFRTLLPGNANYLYWWFGEDSVQRSSSPLNQYNILNIEYLAQSSWIQHIYVYAFIFSLYNWVMSYFVIQVAN